MTDAKVETKHTSGEMVRFYDEHGKLQIGEFVKVRDDGIHCVIRDDSVRFGDEFWLKVPLTSIV